MIHLLEMYKICISSFWVWLGTVVMILAMQGLVDVFFRYLARKVKDLFRDFFPGLFK